MKSRCKDCIFWRRFKDEQDPTFGRCSSPQFRYFDVKSSRVPFGSNTLIYADASMSNAEFATGEDFGCVHFKGETSLGDWNLVEHGLPDEFPVLGYDQYYGRIGTAILGYDKTRLIFTADDDCDITHWMQLPEAPDE